MEQQRNDIIEVISKLQDIDPQGLISRLPRRNWTGNGVLAPFANIPIKDPSTAPGKEICIEYDTDAVNTGRIRIFHRKSYAPMV